MKRATIWSLTVLVLLEGVSLTSPRVIGQTTAPSGASLSREQADQLLTQAQAAIKNRKFDEAEAIIAQVESSGPAYNVFDLGISPKTVQKALDEARHQTTMTTASRANPFANQGPNPLGGSPVATPAPAALPTATNPGAMQPGQSNPFASEASPSNSNNEALRRQSAPYLRDARIALADGDTQRARAIISRAKEIGATFNPGEDSPSKIEGSILQLEEVMTAKATSGNDPAWKHHYASILMQQAEALIAWKQLDAAERLAQDAQRFGGPAGTLAQDPAKLLARIDAARASAAGTNAPSAPAPAIEMGGLGSGSEAAQKTRALAMMQQARQFIANGNFDEAERIAMEVSAINLPDASFGPGEDRPAALALAIQTARMNGVSPATISLPTNEITGAAPNLLPTEISTDNMVLSQFEQNPPTVPTPATLPTSPEAAPLVQSRGDELLRDGETALREHNSAKAMELFREAYGFKDQMDPNSAKRLQDHLQMLSNNNGADELPSPAGNSLLDSVSDQEKLLLRQLSSDLTKVQTDARGMQESNPTKALEILKTAREKIMSETLSDASRLQLLRRLDLSIGQMESYIDQHRASLELDDRNKEILAEIDRSKAMKVEVQNKLAEQVDLYNSLNDQHRFSEAEVVAKRLNEIAPNEMVVKQILIDSKMRSRNQRNLDVASEKEAGFDGAMADVESSAIPFPDNNPFVYGKDWETIAKRKERYKNQNSTLTEREIEIKRRLKMPVELKYEKVALAEVIDGLSQLAGINLHLDPMGLDSEGVRTDTPITINLRQEISLESALNLILQPLRLNYIIQDEVVKITSETLSNAEIKPHVYYVGELVIPVPNFTPSSSVGLQGMINDAHAAMGYGRGGLSNPGPMAFVANDPRHPGGGGKMEQNVLGQIPNVGMNGGNSAPIVNGGPGGMGGGAQADFDSLIELITTTVHAESWDEVGGPGSIKEFAVNLSLVISQTEEVHAEIADLLEQLRKLQDLQVTIEVRFITLSDTFFERIGIDFDFNINDGANGIGDTPIDQLPNGGFSFEGYGRRSQTVGLLPPVGAFPQFTADLDIPFRDDSFNLAVAPAFSNPQEVASFGFAILSDLEAYFLVSAAQGDTRSNVLQAPKVTLFNGQQAFVSDTAQRPFVISVIPVVGDFAAAQQPVIVVLSEGTFMSIQAVISDDRRYVRLTVVPFFSQIGDVDTFTFEGSTTSISGSTVIDDDADGDPNETDQNQLIRRSGTTVQLPTFEFVSVSTTVSVPDGGTVLLGGIKRLSEGRNEFGVPLLSKIPYINRLFRNVGIGRSTDSLMMMVTPRIIIQEEEELRLEGSL